MGVRLGIVRAGERPASWLAARSRAVLDSTLRCPAELWVTVASDDALIVGAFQRAAGMALPADVPLMRRGSGGAEVRIAPGTVHVLLALQAPGALVACDERRIVNRYVRPLLRALTKTGHLAHYFGRDWVSVAHQPVASVGFAHDAGTRRTAFEAFVAVGQPVAVRDRPSFQGAAPASLPGLDPARLVEAIVQAYARDVERAPLDAVDLGPEAAGEDATADPPWAATREEAIGTLGAGPDGRGVFRVGGDLLVSRDALARLEAGAVAAGVDVARLVDQTLAAPGVALDGVRSLETVRDVIQAALS